MEVVVGEKETVNVVVPPETIVAYVERVFTIKSLLPVPEVVIALTPPVMIRSILPLFEIVIVAEEEV